VSCYTTVSSAAALGHLGAVHKRGSGAKTARSREGGGFGRGVYFDDPNGHVMEIITHPYGDRPEQI
jgi:hypothetical protein